MADENNANSSEKTAKSREDRLKAALKANLARRKAQTRVRDQLSGTTEKTPGDTGQEKDA